MVSPNENTDTGMAAVESTVQTDQNNTKRFALDEMQRLINNTSEFTFEEKQRFEKLKTYAKSQPLSSQEFALMLADERFLMFSLVLNKNLDGKQVSQLMTEAVLSRIEKTMVERNYLQHVAALPNASVGVLRHIVSLSKKKLNGTIKLTYTLKNVILNSACTKNVTGKTLNKYDYKMLRALNNEALNAKIDKFMR
ncbi:MAG: hypothetical protein KA028_03500 [Candidatus Pacebacteria bacterium]|nr:hypothetical protein [Candidatus Paceibacterota bacterium]MBP9852184.1 hypothetical protein [Candidatus Paceibacterota bacterium]